VSNRTGCPDWVPSPYDGDPLNDPPDVRAYAAEQARTRHEPGDTSPEPTEPPRPQRYRFVDSAEFLAGDYRPRWLVPHILVRGQPGVIAGPSKGMKTSVLVDLGVSIATATPFLGAFPVADRVRVAIVSGESGEYTLKETCQRVLAAKRLSTSALTGWLKWEFTLPTFADLASMADFGADLARIEADVVLIDPTYLCLGDIDAKNLFEMGNVLRAIAAVLLKLRPGLTVILVHHANRTLTVGEPMELQHLAYSGLEQFARQFILLNRREKYQGDGTHDLWCTVGGSAGHGGLWNLHIEEGTVDEHFGGREWNVTVQTRSEFQEDRAAQTETKRREQIRQRKVEAEAAVLDAIDQENESAGRPATQSQIKGTTGLSTQKVKDLLAALIEDGVIEETTFEKLAGNRAKQRVKGYRRLTLEH
jgi:hypothetical protein